MSSPIEESDEMISLRVKGINEYLVVVDQLDDQVFEKRLEELVEGSHAKLHDLAELLDDLLVSLAFLKQEQIYLLR